MGGIINCNLEFGFTDTPDQSIAKASPSTLSFAADKTPGIGWKSAKSSTEHVAQTAERRRLSGAHV